MSKPKPVLAQEGSGFLSSLKGVFQNIGSLKNSDVDKRESDERLAIRTEEQRAKARNRVRSEPVSFRCKPDTKRLIDELAEKLRISKTDVFDMSIQKLAREHGLLS